MTVIIQNQDETETALSRAQKRTMGQFFHKYFLHGNFFVFALPSEASRILGQQLHDELEIGFVDSNADSFDQIFMQKYRKFFAFLIPFVVAQVPKFIKKLYSITVGFL